MKGIRGRPLTLEDAPQVAALLIERDRELFGVGNYWESTIRSRLTEAGKLEQVSRGVTAPDGALVGFAVVESLLDKTRGSLWWHVASAWRGHDIEVALLRWAEVHAATQYTTLNVSEYAQEDTEVQLLLRSGFTYRQSFYTMRLDYDGAPPEASIPNGFRLVSYADQPALRTYVEIEAEAFRDNWGEAETVVDENIVNWQEFVDTAPDFDPACWWLAYHGDEPAGAVMTQTASYLGDDVAWVNSLGVLPKFQRRGLGTALIARAISAFYRRGNTGIGLGAEAANPTAVQMYLRAGMRIYQQVDSYEKRLMSRKT